MWPSVDLEGWWQSFEASKILNGQHACRVLWVILEKISELCARLGQFGVPLISLLSDCTDGWSWAGSRAQEWKNETASRVVQVNRNIMTKYLTKFHAVLSQPTIYCKSQAFHILSPRVQHFALFTIKPPEAPKNTPLSNHLGQFDVSKNTPSRSF